MAEGYHKSTMETIFLPLHARECDVWGHETC